MSLRPVAPVASLILLFGCVPGKDDDTTDDRTTVVDSDDPFPTDTTDTTDTDETPAHDSAEPECPDDLPLAGSVANDPSCAGQPQSGPLSAQIKWEWRDNPTYPGATDIMMTPITTQLTDDDRDGDIDAADVPDLVFAAFIDQYEFPRHGPMVALSGTDGAQLWAFEDVEGVPVAPLGGIAAGDIDGDGVTELVAVNYDDQVFALHPPTNTQPAELLWVTQLPTLDTKVFPALADFEGDGLVEVAVGPFVVNHDGSVRWLGDIDSPVLIKMLSLPIDVDLDGELELVSGNTVYETDGTVLHRDSAIAGYTVIVQADADPAPEYVRTANQLVEVLDDDYTPIFSLLTPEAGGGPPVVADFDGDGVSEIGVAFITQFRTFELDGTPLWDAPMLDSSSVSLSAVAFDFEGDGALEVVLADESTLWVFDGPTGAVKLQWDAHGSGTSREYPLVVDLDADGAAEIVLPSNDYFIPGTSGITVLSSATDPWPSAPRIWNQYNYHVDNVLSDGSIPETPAHGWLTHNTVRAALTDGPVGLARPDWRVGELETCLVECDRATAVIFAPVENVGAVDGGAVELEVVTASGSSTLVVGVVPAGGQVYVGPIELAGSDFAGDVVLRVLPAGDQCDTANDELVLTAHPCG